MLPTVIQEKHNLRSFGLLMAALVAALFGLFLPWLLNHDWPRWPWWVAAVFVIAALIWPTALGPVQRVWLRFGAVMAIVNVYVLLGVVFFGLITPLAAGLRLVRIDLLNHTTLHPQTYRTPSKPRDARHLEKPF